MLLEHEDTKSENLQLYDSCDSTHFIVGGRVRSTTALVLTEKLL